MRYSRSWPEVGALLLIAACATGAQGHGAAGAPSDAADCASVSQCGALDQDPGMVPAGFGSLRQDQVGVNLATASIRIRPFCCRAAGT